jgi:ribonuclease D
MDARVERLKASRNRIAAELGLDPGVLCGRATLEAVARAGTVALPEMRKWQIDVLGDALRAALS